MRLALSLVTSLLFVASSAAAQPQPVRISEDYVVADVRSRSLPEEMENSVPPDPAAFVGFPAVSRNGRRVVALRVYTYAGNADVNHNLEGLVAEYYDARTGTLVSKYRVIGIPHAGRRRIDAEAVARRVRRLNRRLANYRPLGLLGEAEERDGVVRSVALERERRWQVSGPLDDAHAVPRYNRAYWEYGCHPGVAMNLNVYGGGQGEPVVMVFQGTALGCFCELWWDPGIRVLPAG